MSKCSLWDGVVLLRYTGCLDRHPQLHDGPRRNKTAERWARLTHFTPIIIVIFLCFYVSAGFQLTSGFTPSWRATVCCSSAAGRFTQHASVQSLRLSATTSVPPPQVCLACYSVAQGASYKLALVLLKKTKKKQRRSRCVSGSVNTCSWLICDATPNSNLSTLCAATYPLRIQTGPHINANECCCSTWGQQRLSARNGDSCCSHWQKQLIHTVKY